MMSTSNSESESKEPPRSSEEDERTENGHSYEENGNMNENGAWHAPSKDESSLLTLAFPISRVRRLVKSESEVQWVGVEAGYLIAKATESFLEKMVEGAFERMQANRQGSILYPHLSSHVATTERLEFLQDFVPIKIPGATALANASKAEKQ
jgi:hypothetical protein